MVTHYIITNREVTSRKSRNYISVNEKEYMRKDGDEEARHNLRYGTVSFNPEKVKKLSDFDIKILPDVETETLEKYADGQSVNKKVFPSTQIFEELYKNGIKAKEKEDILVFVHGFRNDLETALVALGELHKKYVEPINSPIQKIVLFTWPAKKKMLKYRSDAYDAEQSGFALARSMGSLREFFRQKFVAEKKPGCNQNIHLLCHSMGNRVLQSMISSLIAIDVPITNMFGEIILAAPDVDYDAMQEPKPLYKLIDLGQRVHVYFNNRDLALEISETTKNSFNRLGRWGAKKTDRLPDDVYECDVTETSDAKGISNQVTNHSYFIASESVIEDIKAVLRGDSSIFNF